jgi:hypothetical protein
MRIDGFLHNPNLLIRAVLLRGSRLSAAPSDKSDYIISWQGARQGQQESDLFFRKAKRRLKKKSIFVNRRQLSIYVL